MTNIAILGFGVVGGGITEVIEQNKKALKAYVGDDIYVKKILDLRDFPDSPYGDRVVHDVNEIVNDPEITVVCETMGGVNPAFDFSVAMLKAGKHMVTANKELVAKKGLELTSLAEENGVYYFFEPSVGGGIPEIRGMRTSLAGDTITDDEMRAVLKGSVKQGQVVPVYGGYCTGKTFAVRSLMDAMLKYLPSPVEAEKADESAPLSAVVFKTLADSYGKISLIRVYGGVLKADSTVYNVNKGENERIGKLYVLRGKKQIEVSELRAGDIGAATKLNVTLTGDTLAKQGAEELEGVELPNPAITMAIVPQAKGDEEKISAGLSRLREEDPTFKIKNNKETKELTISGTGELHLDVITSKLKDKFGIGVELKVPKIAYRETIRKSVKVQGRHKKQSGGHGQFGDVWIEFSRHEGAELIFEEQIVGGAVPKNYFPAVEKGLLESIAKGVLAGYPVVGLKAVLVDGSYHPVDSSEMAFKVAASIAYKDGLAQANPVLLEPIGHLEVTMPEDLMGDIIGDINKRRGRILGMNPIGDGLGEVVAEVPEAEMCKYATDLRSMTRARGKFTFAFERYEEVPDAIAQKVIAESAKE